MRRINPAKAALSVGAVIGLYHLAWIVLVATGAATAVLDFVLRLHFISIDYQMAPFSIGTAVGLLALTFTIGSLFGLLFAVVWNWLTAGRDSALEPALSTSGRASA
jgi:hypothetical protein